MVFQDYTDVRSRYISLGAIATLLCKRTTKNSLFRDGKNYPVSDARLTRIATMTTPVDSHLISMTLVETTSNVKTEQTK